MLKSCVVSLIRMWKRLIKTKEKQVIALLLSESFVIFASNYIHFL